VLFGKPSRRMWLVAIMASMLCVAGLIYALVTDWDAPADRQLEPTQRQVASGGSGFSLGLVLGIGAGVVLGSLLAMRSRDQRDVSRSHHSSRKSP
jgi:hypothetical protein